jgi:hypothetical protein
MQVWTRRAAVVISGLPPKESTGEILMSPEDAAALWAALPPAIKRAAENGREYHAAEEDRARARKESLHGLSLRMGEPEPCEHSGHTPRYAHLPEERRQRYACKVCGNWPDEDGDLEHGKGCYTQSEDGGGSEFVEMEEDEAAP